MADITLVKTHDIELTEIERVALQKLLFGGYVAGLGDDDQAEWHKVWSRIKKLGEGELMKFTFKVIRNGKFHRRFFAMLNVGYDAWEPQRKHKSYKGIPVTKNFEQFREDVLILSGFYEQTFDLNGHMVLKAKSISFSNMCQDEFEKVYSAVCDVLLEKVLTTYKDRAELDQVIERLIGFL